MPDPSEEAAIQQSRLRIGQVWRRRHGTPVHFVQVLSFTPTPIGDAVELISVEPGLEDRWWVTDNTPHATLHKDFFEYYELHWEAGNKALGGATDLTDKLKQIRRDPGRAGRPVDLIGERRREYEATHPRPEGADIWWRNLDMRAHPAAFELSRRRIDLLAEIGDRQAEIDRIDTALDALASMEAKEGE